MTVLLPTPPSKPDYVSRASLSETSVRATRSCNWTIFNIIMRKSLHTKICHENWALCLPVQDVCYNVFKDKVKKKETTKGKWTSGCNRGLLKIGAALSLMEFGSTRFYFWNIWHSIAKCRVRAEPCFSLKRWEWHKNLILKKGLCLHNSFYSVCQKTCFNSTELL